MGTAVPDKQNRMRNGRQSQGLIKAAIYKLHLHVSVYMRALRGPMSGDYTGK